MPSIVTLSDVSFELSNGRLLFKNLNFSLEATRTALVGPNGVGKTCLAKLIANELEPTSGAIRRKGAVTFFPQRQTPESLTVDEFLAAHSKWSALGDRLLTNIPRQTFCSELSGGQWMRVRLARALHEGFLILDEPTNDLDRQGRNALFDFLQSHTNGILLISHDRECLELCDNVLELSNRGLTKYGGGWSGYEDFKQLERESLKSSLESAKRDRERLQAERIAKKERQEKRNQRGVEMAAQGGLPKILLGARKRRAQVTTGAIDIATLERAHQAVRDAHEAFNEMKVDPVMYAGLTGCELPSQKLIAEAHGFNLRFHDWIFAKDLDFIWRGNIRLALKGANGAGKSSLIKAITGTKFETRGELRVGSLQTLYIDQHTIGLNDSKSVFENVRDVSVATDSEIRNNLAKFLFTKETVFQKVSSLSGGERLRAALAQGLMSREKPELLILDEPTNNLDLANIRFLENLVREFRGALIMVSHDEVFLRNCGVMDEFVVSKSG